MKDKHINNTTNHPENQWFTEAKRITTLDELKDFANKMLNDVPHTYATTAHAIAAIAIAGANLGAHMKGITGFQSSFVMWDFIREWNYSNNKCGLKLLNYDDMLYPQFDYKFTKTISKEVWKHLQEEAKYNLQYEGGCPEVKAHWQSIVDGKIPFGFTLEQ